MMGLEGWDIVTSFYFISPLATAEGPCAITDDRGGQDLLVPHGVRPIGAAISAITFTFGPLFGSILKEEFTYVEKEGDKLKTRLERKSQAHSSTNQQK